MDALLLLDEDLEELLDFFLSEDFFTLLLDFFFGLVLLDDDLDLDCEVFLLSVTSCSDSAPDL